MSNAYRIAVGKNVEYRFSTGKWIPAKVTSLTNQTTCVLAIISSTGSRIAVNSGTSVSKRTSHNQTNVWRPY